MESYESLVEQLNIIKKQLSETKRILKSNSLNNESRIQLREKIKTLKQLKEGIEDQLEYYGVKDKKRKSLNVSFNDNFDSYQYQRQILSSESNLENQKRIKASIKRAKKFLTPKQYEYFIEFYNEGKSMQMIADEHNIDRSAVSRVANRGCNKIKKCIKEDIFVNSCYHINDDNKKVFNFLKFLQSDVLNVYRKRIIFLFYTHPKSKLYSSLSFETRNRKIRILIEIAEKLKINKSTVSRLFKRAINDLKELNLCDEFVNFDINMNQEQWNEMTIDDVNKVLNIK